jgi:hypothetical protein
MFDPTGRAAVDGRLLLLLLLLPPDRAACQSSIGVCTLQSSLSEREKEWIFNTEISSVSEEFYIDFE